ASSSARGRSRSGSWSADASRPGYWAATSDSRIDSRPRRQQSSDASGVVDDLITSRRPVIHPGFWRWLYWRDDVDEFAFESAVSLYREDLRGCGANDERTGCRLQHQPRSFHDLSNRIRSHLWSAVTGHRFSKAATSRSTPNQGTRRFWTA